jgi:LytS/YehU family sensor histidine kinase
VLSLPIAALLCVPSIAATDVLARAFGREGWRWAAAKQELAGHLLAFEYMTLQTLVVVQGLLMRREARERERRALVFEGELAKAQLQSLKLQLQPHFLFNTLNGIATLMHRDVATAERMVVQLGDLLRLALQDGQSESVPLERELEFLSLYLGIERMRFADRLTWEFDVPDETRIALVPHLLLHPLVENAVRHGLAPRAEQGRVRVGSRRVGDLLELVVEDDGVGLPREPREGIGLSNTRTRLERLYGARQHLTLEPRAGGGTRVTVSLPFEASTEHAERR